MRPNPRSRVTWLVLAIVVLAVIREVSIRRHERDVDDWPRAG